VTLLAPLALWGAVALLVPLLLHLRRRRVGRTIQVGSLRHLDTLPTAERRGPRVRDPWRLLLRAAIVGLLVLLLAEPALVRTTGRSGPFILPDTLLTDPWRRVQELDDSLPAGIPLVVAATSRSDAYDGPRPTVGRPISWLPIPIDPRASSPATSPYTVEITPDQRSALTAALDVVAESFGPLTDTIGWMRRLPVWWRDSLEVAAFPIAVAHAVAPARTRPLPVTLSAAQLAPREIARSGRGTEATDLHWWLWGVLVLLFLAERLWARSLPEGA
jgi:hypothetical protein